MPLRTLALGLLLLSCSSLLSGVHAQATPPACQVNTDCKGTLNTCCQQPDGTGVCIDPKTQQCLPRDGACDNASVCVAHSFQKSCCPPGTKCLNGQCGLPCGTGDCQHFCAAEVAFCTAGQCIANGALCQLQPSLATALDTYYYPCAQGYNCTDIMDTTKVGCCPKAQACGDPTNPLNVTCCAAGQTCKNNKCVAGAVATIACTNGDVKIGGTCCNKAQVCGIGNGQSCCAAGQVCALGQCVLPATATPSATVSQLCGKNGYWCGPASACINGTCVLKPATCGTQCCPMDTVCVSALTGPVCCSSEKTCGFLGMTLEGVRTPQYCCASGQTCLPTGKCGTPAPAASPKPSPKPSPTPSQG